MWFEECVFVCISSLFPCAALVGSSYFKGVFIELRTNQNVIKYKLHWPVFLPISCKELLDLLTVCVANVSLWSLLKPI